MRLILGLILFSTTLLAQTPLINKADYDRLVIVDEYNHNYQLVYGRIYTVNLKDSLPQLICKESYRNVDSLSIFYRMHHAENWTNLINQKQNQSFQIISHTMIDSLINYLNDPKNIEGLFSHYNINRQWLSKNKERLFQAWLAKTRKTNKWQEFYVKHLLNDTEAFQDFMIQYSLSTSYSDYSSVTLAFENDKDTLVITSAHTSFHLLPWEIYGSGSNADYKNYNASLSAYIGQLLPDDLVINKYNLKPTIQMLEENIVDWLMMELGFMTTQELKRFYKIQNR